MVGSGEAENADYLMRFNGLGNQQHGFRLKSRATHMTAHSLAGDGHLVHGQVNGGRVQFMVKIYAI